LNELQGRLGLSLLLKTARCLHSRFL
jgi:hypothetical protein